MRARGADGVTRFSVAIELANSGDLTMVRLGRMPADQVRRETIQGVVGSEAARLVLPEAVVKRLGLPMGDSIPVKYADGRRARRKVVKGVFARLLDRDGTFTAIVEPKRETALIGAIVLEDLDFLVDCSRQRLVPRDPSGPLSEIE